MTPSFELLDLELFNDAKHIEADWELLETTGHCTAFQTRAWLQPFYRDVAPSLGLEPLFLRVTDAATDKPLMLWPLVRQRRLGLTLVAFADAGVSDFNAPLVADGISAAHEAWLWKQALQALRPQGTVLQLQKLPARHAVRANPLIALVAGAAPMSFGTWAVDLPATLDDFLDRRLAPSFVKDLAMRRRRLEKKGALTFAIAETPEARRVAFDTLARQRARRFAETGRVDVLAEPAFRRFYESAAVDRPGATVRLFTLSVDATCVAVVLALDHAGTRHMVMPSFEAGEWKNCSPGNVLMLMCIEQAMACGLGRFDFTIGDEAYKSGFGATRETVWRGLLPLSLSGRVAVGAARVARGVRERLRESRQPRQLVAHSVSPSGLTLGPGA